MNWEIKIEVPIHFNSDNNVNDLEHKFGELEGGYKYHFLLTKWKNIDALRGMLSINKQDETVGSLLFSNLYGVEEINLNNKEEILEHTKNVKKELSKQSYFNEEDLPESISIKIKHQ